MHRMHTAIALTLTETDACARANRDSHSTACADTKALSSLSSWPLNAVTDNQSMLYNRRQRIDIINNDTNCSSKGVDGTGVAHP